MQQFFQSVSINDRKYIFSELTFSQAIGIARIPQSKNEARLTQFLKCVFEGTNIDPLAMTAQERYYLLLSYLAQQQNALSAHRFASQFLKPQPSSFVSQSLPEDGIFVTLMTGRLAELLENTCGDLVDWITGVLATQVTHPDLPPLPDLQTDDAALLEQFKARCKAIGAMPTSKFNHMYSVYTRHMSDLSVLVHLGVDKDGITVLGGADDAPTRFRPSAAFTGSVGQLVQSIDAAR